MIARIVILLPVWGRWSRFGGLEYWEAPINTPLNRIHICRYLENRQAIDSKPIRTISQSLAAIAVLLPLGAPAALAQANEVTGLTRLSIEQLMEIEIVSVSKKPQRLADAAAAIHVITSDDIRRSGATSIPELLRDVPGLHVARVNSNSWAITSRGFSRRFANKLLVLIDGRTVYSPIFSGTFWDVQDTLLADIDRIEVIRGPGGTIWGANAVNGVINIITKNAKDTEGGYAKFLAGNQETATAAVRYGGKLGAAGHFRAFGKHLRRNEDRLASGGGGADQWDVSRAGFRYDGETSIGDTVMVQSEVYDGHVGETRTVPILTTPFSFTANERHHVNGQFLLGEWQRSNGESSNLNVRGYYDRSVRGGPSAKLSTHTVDAEFRHRFGLTDVDEIVWGAGYRLNLFDLSRTDELSLTPNAGNYQVFSGFIQNEHSFLEDTLLFTAGSKFEHNDFTGFEIQPSARLLWRPDQRNSVWGALSRAVRTPSLGEEGVTATQAVVAPVAPNPLPTLVRVVGTDIKKSEEVISFELGYRAQPTNVTSFDTTVFFNLYDDLTILRSLGAAFVEATPAPTHIASQFTNASGGTGEAFGTELSGEWRATEKLRLRGSYSYFKLEIHAGVDALTGSETAEAQSPIQQARLNAQYTPRDDIELDATVRFVDGLPANNIDSYTALDLRISWKPVAGVELFVVGQNILDPIHPEFISEFFGTNRTEIRRSIYSGVTLRF